MGYIAEGRQQNFGAVSEGHVLSSHEIDERCSDVATVTVALNVQRSGETGQLQINGRQGKVVVDVEGVHGSDVNPAQGCKLGVGDEDA